MKPIFHGHASLPVKNGLILFMIPERFVLKHSRAPPAFRTPVALSRHSALHAGRVMKPFSHSLASRL